MTLSLSLLYFVYLALVAIALLFTFFIAFHMIRYGLLTLINFFILIFFLGIMAGIIYISWEFTSQIDWQQTIQIDLSTPTKFF